MSGVTIQYQSVFFTNFSTNYLVSGTYELERKRMERGKNICKCL